MAGTLVARELNERVRFSVGGPEDESGIRRLLRENPMSGAVRVSFEREPDYFRGAGIAGGRDETIVAYECEHLICMGRSTQRDCWVDGRSMPVTYLAELRLDQEARRRFQIVRDGYRFFQKHHDGTPCFTSIASDNFRARRFLEGGLRGLPTYGFLGELTTLMVEVPRRPRPYELRLASAQAEQLSNLVRLLNQHGHRYQLATVWTEERLGSLSRHGLPLDQIYMATIGDELIGCGAIWDQRLFRQTVVQGYHGFLGAARPLVNTWRGATGKPLLPAPGVALKQAFLSPLALVANHEDRLPEFVEAFLPLAAHAGAEWLTLALPAGDPRIAALRRRTASRVWSSRLYQVTWPGAAAVTLDRSTLPFQPDVSLL
jgi:hypothetical protein